jgi:hypothetical protein
MILLLIVSAHAFSYHTRLWIRSGFSAATGTPEAAPNYKFTECLLSCFARSRK